ncbi:hypothetical protein FPZ24_10765 [Sphingomonas panacisoli]|uniref:Flippase-like domain-containing protein n=1 Tax=Sphingomonas panacisoli TaxID=1813879 RepID=A0A5B8LI33_9SPHN|nr:hypothetical protein [Sphingomonas panacisoli]QDZ07908.1 hypothetical protein FPZ24_10765 [Sphingomonas panacisoli]
MLQSLDVPINRSPRDIGAMLIAPSTGRNIIRNWGGVVVSLAILAAVAIRVQGVDFVKIMSIAPGVSLFWPAFLCFYALVPLSHWVIYRRLWGLPIGGIVPLLRKQVANEIVFGYSGEAHFYFWARQHAGLTGSPFGAIKDVSVMSAIAGNVATLFLMIVMAPTLAGFMTGPLATTFQLSVAVIVIFSLLPFVFRRRLFSLSAPALRMVFTVHMVRIALTLGLSAAMWHFLLPDIAVGVWLALATLKMMISRLPLIANKDILFAAATMLLLGKNADASAAIAFTTSLTLVAHLVVGASTGLASLTERSNAA